MWEPELKLVYIATEQDAVPHISNKQEQYIFGTIFIIIIIITLFYFSLV
jgi:hypothetical protein